MKTTSYKFTGRDIGIIFDRSCYSADTLNAKVVKYAIELGMESDNETRKLLARQDYEVAREDDSETLSWLADEAIDYLNSLELPSFCSFYFEDNCLFLAPSIESASEDVGFQSSRKQEYPDDDYRGEWLHINDHGNATLYCRMEDGKDCEIWAVV